MRILEKVIGTGKDRRCDSGTVRSPWSKAKERLKGPKSRADAGETLVEVMVCAVLFLLMVAVMQGAISFCTNAQHKSSQLRARNAEVFRGLRENDSITSNGNVSVGFNATSADGQTEGNQVFQIQVPLGKKAVSYQDGEGNSQSMDFYLYGPTGTGGGP